MERTISRMYSAYRVKALRYVEAVEGANDFSSKSEAVKISSCPGSSEMERAWARNLETGFCPGPPVIDHERVYQQSHS